ncbi:MAG: 30S ribosomal protein S12 methylthiotransferase RimO [Phycisphaerales bacterium]|nr:30S ribosomal protein S12 methylthiotransferase RimO [Phycisphaerales bacterium]
MAKSSKSQGNPVAGGTESGGGASRSGFALPVLGAGGARPAPSSALSTELSAPVVGFVSLGCAKNLVDSEKMLGQLAEAGCVITGDESAADTIVVNTCGFLESSRQEALGVIHELGERKRAGTLRRIVVAGCLVQRDGEKLREWAPEIDALVGVNNRDDIVRAVWRMDRDAALDRFLGDYHPTALDAPGRWSDQGRVRLTPSHYAYVRISEGCNQKCTFCTIPSIRGPMHSKTPTELLAECRELIADGARELVLIGQDTTSYGGDIGYAPGLAGLLRELNAGCEGARWIRLMYVYPSVFTDEMIDAIASCERVVKYIDMPLQHINDRMLKAMHRRVTRAQTIALIEKLRARIPGVSIRTTFIVGFPGETEAEFGELLEFAQDFGFDAAGAFMYSREPETPAGRMREQHDESLLRDRYERFMLVQREVALAAAKRWVGREFDVLVDADDPEDARGALARHAGQAPEVDGACILPDGAPAVGEFVRVRCTATDEYDLVTTPVAQRRRAGSGNRPAAKNAQRASGSRKRAEGSKKRPARKA